MLVLTAAVSVKLESLKIDDVNVVANPVSVLLGASLIPMVGDLVNGIIGISIVVVVNVEVGDCSVSKLGSVVVVGDSSVYLVRITVVMTASALITSAVVVKCVA